MEPDETKENLEISVYAEDAKKFQDLLRRLNVSEEEGFRYLLNLDQQRRLLKPIKRENSEEECSDGLNQGVSEQIFHAAITLVPKAEPVDSLPQNEESLGTLEANSTYGQSGRPRRRPQRQARSSAGIQAEGIHRQAFDRAKAQPESEETDPSRLRDSLQSQEPVGNDFTASIVMEAALRTRLIEFFKKYGWTTKSIQEKVAILVILAETHPDFSEKTTEKQQLLVVGTEVLGKLAMWHHQQMIDQKKIVVPKCNRLNGNDEQWELTFPAPEFLWQRWSRLFSDVLGCANESTSRQAEVLLDLAESHPHLTAIGQCNRSRGGRPRSFFGSSKGPVGSFLTAQSAVSSLQRISSAQGAPVSIPQGQIRIATATASASASRPLPLQAASTPKNPSRCPNSNSNANFATSSMDSEFSADRRSSTSFAEHQNGKIDVGTMTYFSDFAYLSDGELNYDSDGTWDDDGTSGRRNRANVLDVGHSADIGDTILDDLRKRYVKVAFPLTVESRRRFAMFFETQGWSRSSASQKLEILVRLARTHPDLKDDPSDPPFLDPDELPQRQETPGTHEQVFGYGRMEILMPFELRRKFFGFFGLFGWEKKKNSEKLEILLDLAESHPLFFADTPDERPRFAKERYAASDNGREHLAMIVPKEINEARLTLLEPDYYLKFSEEARSSCPVGATMTFAALANTRRYIVEGRQLKQLLARCICTSSNCMDLVDRRSIKFQRIGFAIKATARCRRHGHQFVWHSSAIVKREGDKSNGTYVLNTVIPAAVPLSGNNEQKMSLFAKIVQLNWPTSHTGNARSYCFPVVSKCFEATQREMLDKLKEENGGRLILVGDGRFESSRACASLYSYTLMAMGVDVDQDADVSQLKRGGYVISQAIVDRRHADNKPANMERVGMHWALQPLANAGLDVSELVTDEHPIVLSDFRKVAAAMAETAGTNENDGSALTAFKNLLTTALGRIQPPVDVDQDALNLLAFYGNIKLSTDIWHAAKNLLKSVSTIAQSAPEMEQRCYRRYAKMLKNYLWSCADGAHGSANKFVELWTIVEKHLRDDHSKCDEVELHSKTALMSKLDPTTNAFRRLIDCVDRIADAAYQLCRNRHLNMLECYNSLTLKYVSSRMGVDYDSVTMRKQLATLDHNHHVHRDFKIRSDGQIGTSHHWSKSTKSYSLSFQKEAKDYAYLGHLMAAILFYRCMEFKQSRPRGAALSANHPSHIQKTLAPVYQSKEATEAQWLSKQSGTGGRPRYREQAAEGNGRKKRQFASSSFGQDEASGNDDSGSAPVKKRKSGRADVEWLPGGVKRQARPNLRSSPRQRKANVFYGYENGDDWELATTSNISTGAKKGCVDGMVNLDSSDQSD